ncbi:hypothetical protein GN244_ATG03173 [Phytophthora infestans]|uniref:Uncharacterized protein n=1 Tax=Phytophthora infestans TaxID=4787 RepID=A0A833WNW2_PHYIN|nr:hypothetical protein GN244_ATG03173 [Phytophthora infestans]
MGPDHPSDINFASNAASDGDASSDREPPRKKTKRGGNKAEAAPKPRKAARGWSDPDQVIAEESRQAGEAIS